MANEFITRKGFISLDDSTVSGSLFVSGTIEATQTAVLEGLQNAATDTDKFLVATTDGTVKFRTGAEVLSDIGAAGGATAAGKEGEISWFNSNTSISGSGWMRVVTGSTYGIDLDGYYYSSKTDGSQGAKFIAIENETSASVTKQNLMNFGIDSGAFTWIGYSGSYGGGSAEVGRFIIDKGFTNHYRLGTANFSRAAKTNTFYVWPETTFFNGVNMEGHLTITGSLTVSGSNTFRNIGPAYFTEGNVGIGTTTPATKLAIQTSNEAISVGQTSYNYSSKPIGLQIAGWDTAYTNGAGIKFHRWNGTADNYYAGYIGHEYNGSEFILGFRTDFTSSLQDAQTTRMAISSNGNVGIGTTTPSDKLDVHGIIALNSVAFISQSGNTGFIGDIDAIDAIGNLDINTAGGSTRLYLDDSGHVGINTDVPNYSLDIALAASSDRLNITRGGAQKAYITGDGAGVFYANLVSYGNSLSGGGGMFQYGGGYGTQAVAHRFKHITGTFTGTSGDQTMVEILPSVSQSATAGYTGLKVNV